MPDKQNPDDPQYDWLYSGDRRPAESSDQPADPESTQMMGRHDEPEHTRIMRSQPRPDPDGQSEGPHPGRSQSFGGTYAQPQRGEPRFATPSQPPRGPQQRGSGRPPPPRRSRRKPWVRGIFAFLILWLIFLIAVPVYAWTKVSKVDAEPAGDRPEDTPGTTYLLVGSDSREGLTKEQRGELGTGTAAGNRTDTILLLHIPDGDGPNLLMSIPRDSYVTIPGKGDNKINAAYSMGGPDLLVNTVEKATDLHVDDYIEVGFTGLVNTVDALGGVEVCPKESITDKKAKLDISKGCQEVDGKTALGYSRSRDFARGDITRAHHQREVIGAIGSKAASWQTIVFPWRYWSTNMAGADSLQVGENVGPIDLLRFAWAMSKSGGKDTKRCVVPYSTLGASTSAGSSVLWDEQKSEALFDSIREDDTSSIHCSPE